MKTLADYVAERRESLGLNQKQLAERADIPANMVNRIEKGVTKLPSPDFRRRLAVGLGVSHLDILVAAGELEPEEATVAGATLTQSGGVPPDVRAVLEDIDWTNLRNITRAKVMLETIRDTQRLHPPGAGELLKRERAASKREE